MQGLLNLDTRLFHWLNQSLANPLFDHAMPWLSGNVLFVPALVVVALGLVFKGGVRGRACLLLLMLAVGFTDGMVCNTLKHALARPRPYVTLEATRLATNPGLNPTFLVVSELSPTERSQLNAGRGAFRSLPSSHAANWTAATLVMFVFYRRSIRFLAPLAFLVSFSRIYNGVHYPSDVLAGWALGAGSAAWVVFTAEWLWSRMGKKFFPLWQERFPSLLQPRLLPPGEVGHSAPTLAALRERQWLHLGYLLIATLLAFRLWYIGAGIIGLTGDEAYQWTWSQHLALSYYSKPPMIALAQWAGTSLWGDTEFGVRFFSPVAAALLSLVLLRFFAREVSAGAGLALLLTASATPLLVVGSTLMTVDPLNVLFWTLAMIAGWRATGAESRTRDWLWTGLWLGLGFLSKYTTLLQVSSFALFFLLWPGARRQLRRPGPWLALGILALATLPVLIWNAQHDWVTVRHVAEDGRLDRKFVFTLKYLGEFLGSEFGLLNPVFFVGFTWAALALWKRTPRDRLQVYLFSMGATTFGLYLLQSLHARVLPNWIAPSVVPFLALMVVFWRPRWNEPQVRRTWAWGFGLGVVAFVLLADTRLIGKLTGWSLPPDNDPARRGRGWDDGAATVRGLHATLAAEGKPAFVLAGHYGLTGLLTFYWPEARAAVTGQPLVYPLRSPHPHDPTRSRVENQFHLWPNYDYRLRHGDNALFIEPRRLRSSHDGSPPPPAPPPEELLRDFASVQTAGIYPVRFRGQTLRWFQVYECRGLR
jgi:4-amino-4-deoxy-L-arabinose transferase-like glycosyltransferase/membrane-associated phospholipid phosphatase